MSIFSLFYLYFIVHRMFAHIAQILKCWLLQQAQVTLINPHSAFLWLSFLLRYQLYFYNTHCKLYTSDWLLETVHFSVHSTLCQLHNKHDKLYSVYCSVFSKHCTLYTVHCTLYSVYCTHCTLYNVYCTRYSEHCTL